MFSKAIIEKCKEFGIALNENDMMGGQPGGQPTAGGDGAPPAMPQAPINASPNPEMGAQKQPVEYDKPYMDLAKIMYKALRTNFEDLETSKQRKIMSLKPDDIKTDEQGVSIIKAFEDTLSEFGPEPQSSDDESGGGFGPAVS